MAGVTGPIRTLPGSHHLPPAGTECDYCTAIAVIRIQGETDSYGSEMIDYCKECFDKTEGEIKDTPPVECYCDWCNAKAILKPTRDYDEGNTGPVYNVCESCRDKQRDAWRDETGDNQEDENLDIWAYGVDGDDDWDGYTDEGNVADEVT